MPSFDNLNSKQLVGPEVQTKSRKSKYSRKGPRYVLYSTVTNSDNTKRKGYDFAEFLRYFKYTIGNFCILLFGIGLHLPIYWHANLFFLNSIKVYNISQQHNIF